MGGAAVCWRSSKQSSGSFSSMESKYIALCNTAQVTIWLRRILEDNGQAQTQPTPILIRGQSVVYWVRPVRRTTKRSKHIGTKEMFVRDLHKKGVIRLEYRCSEDMVAGTLTKSLGAVTTNKFAEKMGVLWSCFRGNERSTTVNQEGVWEFNLHWVDPTIWQHCICYAVFAHFIHSFPVKSYYGNNL